MGEEQTFKSSKLSDEDRLVLLLGKLDPPAEHRSAAREICLQGRLSWEQVLKTAVQHWVHPFLALHCANDAAIHATIPEAVRLALRSSSFIAKQRHAQFVHALTPAIQKLNEQKIPVALMKGAALLATIYPEGTRILNDLDVLIRKSDFSEVADAVQTAGFMLVLPEGKSLESILADYHEVTFVRRSSRHSLAADIHWQLCPDRQEFFAATETLLDRARPVRFGDCPVFALSPEDIFLQLATQLVRDRFHVGLLRVADIHALASRGLDWDLLGRIAVISGASGAVYLAAEVARMMGAETAPARFREEMIFHCPGCAAASRFLADPRWLLSHWGLSAAARRTLQPLFYQKMQRNHPSSQRRAGKYALLSQSLRTGFGRGRIQALAKAVQSGVWGLGFFAADLAARTGAGRLETWVHDRLWKERRASSSST